MGKTLKYTLLSSLLCLSAFSCTSIKEEFQPVFSGNENPPHQQVVTMTPTHTIAELASLYKTGSPWKIDKNIVISGIVSTTDRPGNFYKSFYIQDETGGMEIKIGKNGLYNDYLPGQRIYVDCRELCLGMYGYKSGTAYGNGMVQIGFSDPTGEYETSYLESSLLIDSHVFKGEIGPEVEPVVVPESSLPASTATQATSHYVGKLVTVKNLTYGWYDTRYKEQNEAFALLYLNSNQNKKLSSNRIFISGAGTGINTWAMSKEKMAEYLYSGVWDEFSIGNANDYNYGKVGDYRNVDAQGKVSYPGIEKAAASVSHYFSTPNGTCIQVRTSGFSKFADRPIPESVLNGSAKVDVTGILALYPGKIQMVVNNISDIKVVE